MELGQKIQHIEKLAKLARYYILHAVKSANSGHTTTALSATDIMTTLYFGVLQQDLDDLDMPNNDRVIFSKGHATPLMYALYAIAGKVTEDELAGFRNIDSVLEGHATYRFKYTEVPTGSLGQGLSVGLGLAYNAKYFDKLPYKTYVLMGDGELAEGQVWEAFSFASQYNLDNVIAIVDMNRLGQTVQTQYGWDTDKLVSRLNAFGWATYVVDGHDIGGLLDAFEWAQTVGKPAVIVAKTIKGKGVSFWEDKNGWHSKPIPADRYEAAVAALGDVDYTLRGEVRKPERLYPVQSLEQQDVSEVEYPNNASVPTKLAFGNAITRLAPKYPSVVVLDGDVQNSTHTELFAEKYSSRFIECFIAEQNMVSLAQGLARRGKRPFVVTFAAFLTRAFDQFRMAALGDAPIRVCGSYVGASVGKDGASNMGMEDIAMFRALHGSTVLYPADAVATEKLTETLIQHDKGIIYLRTAREPLPNIYAASEDFPVGGSKVLKSSDRDTLTVVAAGITVYEALKAYEKLLLEGVNVRIVDSYSIKPIDTDGLLKAAQEAEGIVLVVEDHWFEGGLGDAVLNVFAPVPGVRVHKMAVTKTPVSGEPLDVLRYVGIDADSIYRRIKEILSQ